MVGRLPWATHHALPFKRLRQGVIADRFRQVIQGQQAPLTAFIGKRVEKHWDVAGCRDSV